MSKALDYFKKYEIGMILNAVCLLVSLIVTVFYLCFSLSAKVFNVGIFFSFLGAVAVGFALNFKIPYIRNYLPILTIFLLTMGLTFLAMNSVGDITEFFSGVGMYGNRNNVYPRFAIMILSFVAIVVEIVALFLGTDEKRAD